MNYSTWVGQALHYPQRAIHKFTRESSHLLDDAYRLWFQGQRWSAVVNQKEIRIVGMRRCGNHAIIGWMQAQEPGVVKHLNNLKPHINPYRYKYEHLRDHYPQYQGEIQRLKPLAQGNFTPKDCLLCSYEDYDLRAIASKTFERLHNMYVGKTQHRFDVLILRDPFNLFASRMKSKMVTVQSSHQTMVDLWIEYAKEFLGETHYLPHHKVVINYNQWFLDSNYRQDVAEQLQIPFTDAGLDRVSGCGGGSSFEGLNYAGRTQQMPVLERWKAFAHDSDYRSLFQNPELLAYSEKIFGPMPETEVLSQP